MEELVLTDPITQPAEVTEKYRVVHINMDSKYPDLIKKQLGLVQLTLWDNLDKPFQYQYTGQVALDFIKFVNTGNFSNTSLNKRILQRLSDEGILPGTVVGVPDS